MILNKPGLQINLTDNTGQTALDYANKRKLKTFINKLIEHGATPGNPEHTKTPGGAYEQFGQPGP